MILVKRRKRKNLRCHDQHEKLYLDQVYAKLLGHSMDDALLELGLILELESGLIRRVRPHRQREELRQVGIGVRPRFELQHDGQGIFSRSGQKDEKLEDLGPKMK